MKEKHRSSYASWSRSAAICSSISVRIWVNGSPTISISRSSTPRHGILAPHGGFWRSWSSRRCRIWVYLNYIPCCNTKTYFWMISPKLAFGHPVPQHLEYGYLTNLELGWASLPESLVDRNHPSHARYQSADRQTHRSNCCKLLVGIYVGGMYAYSLKPKVSLGTVIVFPFVCNSTRASLSVVSLTIPSRPL